MSGPTGLNGGVESGVFNTLASLVANVNVKDGSIVRVFELANRGDYYVSSVDEGDGVLLDNGLYANPADTGGGVMITKDIGGYQTVPAGQTGELISLSATDDDVVELIWLICSGSSAQGGISVEVDGVIVIGPTALADSTPSTSQFWIGLGGAVTQSGGSVRSVKGKNIKVTKDSGNTTQVISYNYTILGPA